jgi:NADPH:quinone reductase-like Zn-dependent oxidoreductase
MRALVRSRYGAPDVLRLEDVPRPPVGPGEALVRIHASSLNSADIDYLKGMSLVRMAAPFRPAHRILGSDIAGVVEAVGDGITAIGPGDDVFADLTEHGFGAFAEYVAPPADALAPMPAGMTYEEAAAVPSAAVIALQGLHQRSLEPGQRVLINGAGGGMGTFAVQIAKALGVEVTGVDRADKLSLVQSLGADHVIDFESIDYTDTGLQYDLILDVAAHLPLGVVRRAMAPDGAYFVIGGSTQRVLDAALRGALLSRRGSQQFGIVAGQANRRADLDELSGLLEAGTIRPVIDSRVPLDETAAALGRLAAGSVRGKVVITI